MKNSYFVFVKRNNDKLELIRKAECELIILKSEHLLDQYKAEK